MADSDIRIRATDDTRAAFDSIRRSFDGIERSAVSLRGVFAGLGAATAVAGFVNLVRSTVDAADELNKLSQKAGVSVEALSKLQYAAKLSDVSTEALGVGLKGLNKAIDGNDGAFKRLGISVLDASGNVRSTEDVLGDVAEAFSKSNDNAAKSTIALQLFGKAGVDLIPLLNAGRSGLKDFGDEAQRLGLVISADTARQAEAFNDNLSKLGTAARSVGLIVAEDLLPPLVKLTEQLVQGQKIFGSFTAALVNIGSTSPFRSLSDQMAKLRGEIDALEKKRRGVLADAPGFGPFSGVGGGGSREGRARALQDDIDARRKRLAFFQAEERQNIATGGADTLDARDLALRTRRRDLSSALDRPKTSAGSKGKSELDRALEEAGRLKSTGATFSGAGLQVQADSMKELAEQDERAAKAAADNADQTQALNAILGQTPTGRLKELEDQQLVLNEALVKGKIDAKQFSEAFDVLDQQRNQVLGRTGDEFRNLGDSGKQAFDDLKTAAQGFGTKFTTTIVESVRAGKLEFGSLADSIISDILRITIQRSITDPLVKAGVAGLGGLFKGEDNPGGGTFRPSGRASGGPVTAGMLYQVNEMGTELFMPSTNGTIVPNGARGRSGVVIQQTVNIGAGVDRAQLLLAMRQATEMAKAEIARERRLGPSRY